MTTATVRTRRARGEVPALMMRELRRAQWPSNRFTPYGLAKRIGVSPGSATAAAKRLIATGQVKCYGTSPLIIGPLEAPPALDMSDA